MTIIDGKELVISNASFEAVMALEEVITKALQANGIKIDLSSIDISSEKTSDMEAGEVGWLIDPVLTMATDREIRKHLFECAKCAMFDKNKVNVDFFEAPENRKYYYPIMMEVLKVNIAPFFGLVSSMLSNLPGMADMLQKLKSPPQD